jgi:hypothetical protein
LNVKGGLSDEGNLWGRGWRRKGEGPGESIEVHYTHTHIHTHEDNKMKPTKHCGVKEYIEEVNLFKVHCMHLWNYHNETLLYY